MRGILDEEVERDLGELDSKDVEITGVRAKRNGKSDRPFVPPDDNPVQADMPEPPAPPQ